MQKPTKLLNFKFSLVYVIEARCVPKLSSYSLGSNAEPIVTKPLPRTLMNPFGSLFFS